MEDNKISHAFWTLLTWVFAILSWTVDHIGAIAGFAAVTASFFSVRASRATERLRLQEQKNLEDQNKAQALTAVTPPTIKPPSET